MRLLQRLLSLLLVTLTAACFSITPDASGTPQNDLDGYIFTDAAAEEVVETIEGPLLVHPQLTLSGVQMPDSYGATEYRLGYSIDNERYFSIQELQEEGYITTGSIVGTMSTATQTVTIRDGIEAQYIRYDLEEGVHSELSWEEIEDELFIMVSADNVEQDEIIAFAEALVQKSE